MDEPLMPDPIILVDPAYERGYAEGLETGMAQAREEIERLREALSAMTELFKATEASAQWALSEVDRLREALKQVGLYAWQGDTFKIMDIVRETIIGKEK